MESYIIQLDFSAAFDSESQWSFIQIEICWCSGSVLSICVEFLSDHRQRVMVDGAESELIPIISGVPQEVCWVLFYLFYTSEMFELVENRLFAYADDSTLLAVVHKPADRPAVAACCCRNLARIQEWYNHWCMILNPSKTKALVISRSRTVSPTHVDLVLPGVSIHASPNLNILGMKFDSMLTFEDHVRGIVSHVSQRIDILRLVKSDSRVQRSTSVVLRCYFAFVVPILEYCSLVWESAAECYLQLLERQVLSRSEFLVVVSSTSCWWA